MASMPRAALGRSASLGDLYDARRDDFCGFSIFKKTIPPAACTLRDAPRSDVKLVHGDNYSDKFKELDVCAELQVSVLGGLFKLKGSGQYLYDQKMSARTVKSSLIYNTKTKEESVNIFHEDVKEAFAIDAIQTGAATHVVVGISWGANCILTCQFENKENSDVTKISGELSAHMSKLSRSISGSSDADFREGDTSTGMKLDVRMFGDVVANGELPTTAEAALQLMKKMPELVKSYNEGKGSPLSYTLLPITTLTPYLNLSIKTDIIIKSLEESSLMRIVQFLDQMSNAKQEMHDFQKDAAEFKFCITQQDYQNIKQLDGKIKIEESNMRSQLATVLTDVRSGKYDVSKMEDLLVIFQKSDMSPHNVEKILSDWSWLVTKINFVRTLIQKGVTYVGRGVSLENELLELDREIVFVLYFSKISGTEDPDRWRKNRQLFINHVKRRQDGNKYFVVDCDIHPDAKKGDKTSVFQVLKEGELDCEDLLEQEQFLKSTPLVKATSSVERTIAKPDKRVRLAIACPGDTCSPSVVYEWFCFKCKKEVEYGFDQFIYCACGKTPTSSLQFRCNDPNHGVFKNDTAYLDLLLSTLRLPEEEQKSAQYSKSNQGNFPPRADDSPFNIFNGFANLNRYKHLDEAERRNLRQFAMLEGDSNE